MGIFERKLRKAKSITDLTRGWKGIPMTATYKGTDLATMEMRRKAVENIPRNNVPRRHMKTVLDNIDKFKAGFDYHVTIGGSFLHKGAVKNV